MYPEENNVPLLLCYKNFQCVKETTEDYNNLRLVLNKFYFLYICIIILHLIYHNILKPHIIYFFFNFNGVI